MGSSTRLGTAIGADFTYEPREPGFGTNITFVDSSRVPAGTRHTLKWFVDGVETSTFSPFAWKVPDREKHTVRLEIEAADCSRASAEKTIWAAFDMDRDGVKDVDDLCIEHPGSADYCGCSIEGQGLLPGEMLFRTGAASRFTFHAGSQGEVYYFGHVAVYAGDLLVDRNYLVRHKNGLVVHRPYRPAEYRTVRLARGEYVEAGDIVPRAVLESDLGYGGVGISNLDNFSADHKNLGGQPGEEYIGRPLADMSCWMRKAIRDQMLALAQKNEQLNASWLSGESQYGAVSNNCANAAAEAYAYAGLNAWSGEPSLMLTPNYLASWMLLRPLSAGAPPPVPDLNHQIAFSIQLLVRSPVRVHVRDSMGRHTGPAVGGLESRIPGTEYWELENGHKLLNVFARGRERYTVRLEATDAGSFDMEVSTADHDRGGKIVTARFDRVAISRSTQATVELDTSAITAGNAGAARESLTMKVDVDGNGSVDRTVVPVVETRPLEGNIPFSRVSNDGTAHVPPTSTAGPSSSFARGAEGWKTGSFADGGPYDVLRGPTNPQWSASGGKSGGAISMTDPESGSDFCFDAPAAYLGDKRAFYGGALKYELKSDGNGSLLDEPDVILGGGGLVLIYDRPGPPQSGWNTYTVPFTEAGWTVGKPKGTPATRAEFERVLANVTVLRINGEFRGGPDTGSLGSVSLTPASVGGERVGAGREPTPDLRVPSGRPPVTGSWGGTWRNSRGESGSWVMTLEEHGDGMITGVDDGQKIIDGRRVGDTMTWTMKQADGSRRWTETVKILDGGSTLVANYTGHDARGTYTGGGTLKRR